MSINLFEDSRNQGNMLSLFMYLETLSFFLPHRFTLPQHQQHKTFFQPMVLGHTTCNSIHCVKKHCSGYFRMTSPVFTCCHNAIWWYLVYIDDILYNMFFLYAWDLTTQTNSLAMSKSLANHPAGIASFPGTCFWNHVPSVIYPLKMLHYLSRNQMDAL